MDDTSWDSNSYLFPDDKGWCLTNLEGLNFSVVAFMNKHMDKVASLNLVDIFKLSPEDKLFD